MTWAFMRDRTPVLRQLPADGGSDISVTGLGTCRQRTMGIVILLGDLFLNMSETNHMAFMASDVDASGQWLFSNMECDGDHVKGGLPLCSQSGA